VAAFFVCKHVRRQEVKSSTQPDGGEELASERSHCDKEVLLNSMPRRGITHFTFHDLRHTFGTRLADAGVDVVKIKELMVTPQL
jgi:hypothetical protein